MLRPLIVVEGYEDGAVSNTFERMFGLLDLPIFGGNPPTDNLTDYLYPYEYDLIYIDFDDGSDWIQRNALVVKEVILDLFDDLFGLSEVLVGDEAPELCFDPKDPFVHSFTLRR
jgi:hypothetical protein